jgi:RNA processing factor Prp31
MARDVDPKKTRKALRIIRKLAAKSALPETIDPETGEIKPGEGAVDYSHWENEFLTEVDQRLEKFGSAFHDLSKGSQGARQETQRPHHEKAARLEEARHAIAHS